LISFLPYNTIEGKEDAMKKEDMKIVIIDGQGGKMGQSVIAGATGENPVLVASRDADIIIGPIGIVIADSLLGEITPAMAEAIGKSRAYKILIPVNKCNHHVVGCENLTLTESIALVIKEVENHL
jgi:hypothetical protein